MPAKGNNILGELRVLVNEKRISERIRYHGYKSLGPWRQKIPWNSKVVK